MIHLFLLFILSSLAIISNILAAGAVDRELEYTVKYEDFDKIGKSEFLIILFDFLGPGYI